MKCRLVPCFIVLFFAFESALAEHPLLVSVRLAETDFKNWRYGHRLHRKQLNCVQFVVVVVEELLKRELTAEERRAILISNVGRRSNLPRLINQDDKRIRGIQTALVEMNKGEIIQPSEAKPGDFIEDNGLRCAAIFGSHQSLGGVGIADFEVGLNDPNVRTYLVRFKP
ncbi:hypothetical protein FBQ87_17105 [Sphingobacteriales bacterium CHB3]|nr:hypothetical protein [Sphingobacteriales bacterium CHB3]